MPELPEVEVTRLTLFQAICGQSVQKVMVHQKQLRWLIPLEIQQILPGLIVQNIERRAKYLLIKFTKGTLIIHLGMSGSLTINQLQDTRRKHDHFEIIFKKFVLRFYDPRRFGCIVWTSNEPERHKLLTNLGPEPLSGADLTAEYLYKCSKARKISVKQFIMDNKVVVGVGNIYATEALFLARINPKSCANSLNKQDYGCLLQAIREVLKAAIAQGGTTLKDFRSGFGQMGYFKVSLQVYGRSGEECNICSTILEEIKLGGRASVFCNSCQIK